MSTCFSPASLAFLRALAKNNHREWFAAHKASYEKDVREPFLGLITALQSALADISTHYVADAKPVGGSLFRIQRDTRFSNDKSPYKTWAGARLFHAQGRNIEAPVFYLHVQPGRSFVGAGLWSPQPADQRRVRDFIVDNPVTWSDAVGKLLAHHHYRWAGETLTRAPRGYQPNHPLIEHLKRKSFALLAELDDAEICSPRLTASVGRHQNALAPLVDYLCAALDLPF